MCDSESIGMTLIVISALIAICVLTACTHDKPPSARPKHPPTIREAKNGFLDSQGTLDDLLDRLNGMDDLMKTLRVEKEFSELKAAVGVATIAMGDLKKEMAKSGSISLQFKRQ